MPDIADAPSFVRNGYPREKNIWRQYYGMSTRLRGRIYFSDILLPTDSWQSYNGTKTNLVDLACQTPENYHQTHNHYQNILSEVLNFAPHSNAIPIWGDGSALASGSAAWGAFASARSAYIEPNDPKYEHLKNSIPDGFVNVPHEDFDCALYGLEVDVLNAGKPGIYPNKAKHGVQIVGFGNPNSHAISVICENFDCAPEQRKGQFEAGLYFQQSIHPDYGRVVVGHFDKAQIGIDFRQPVFDWGAIQLNAPKPNSGIMFSEGRGGELYAGKRWPDGEDTPKWMTIRIGEEGLRIVSHDSMREILAVDQHGGIYLNGDIFLNGRRFDPPSLKSTGWFRRALNAISRRFTSNKPAVSRI